MKLYQLILIILITGLISCQSAKNKIVITGKITGEIPEIIEYTIPLNGISYFGFEDSVNPDSLGNFQINLLIDKPCFIELSHTYKAYGTVIAEPGMSYTVFINTELKENAFKIECENEKGQELYNQISNRSMMARGDFELEARKYLKDSIGSKIKQSINSTEEIEIAGFRELLENKTISKEFFNLVNTDREYFYKGVQGSVAFMNFLQSLSGLNSLNEDEFREMWKGVFQIKPVTNPELLSSPWFYYYVQNYLKYNELIVESTNVETLRELRKQGLLHTNNIKNAKKYLTDSVLEYYYAAYIYYEAINKNYEKELISLFEQFKKEYPSSEYTQFIEPEIIPIIAFHKKEGEPFNEKIKFINDYGNFNSFKDVAEVLKGKRIYVDVWATWCRACKIEFKNNAELNELLKSKDVTLLYLSVDKEDRAKQWRDMINYYNLEGYHIRVNEKVLADLANLYNAQRMAIPWYILTDENGNIIVRHASSPAQIEKLEKELNEN